MSSIASPRSMRGSADPIRRAIARCRPHLVGAAAFSALGNLLYLTPSLFMLQVYDRVVPSGSIPTLVALGLLTLAGLAALAAFEWLRSRVLIRASAALEATLARDTLAVAMNRPDLSRVQRAEAMRDFDTVRQGIGSPGVLAAMDAPWTPIYILVAFLLHPALGLMMIVAGAILLVLAWTNEAMTASPMKRAGEAVSIAYARQNHAAAFAAEARALGMVQSLSWRQAGERGAANALQLEASFAGSAHGSIIKFFRLAVQSGSLALGAVLVIEGSLSAGSMIAASLLMSRALAPIEQAVGSWRTIVSLRAAYRRLSALFDGAPAREHTALPAPTGAVQLEQLTVCAPLTGRVLLSEIGFAVEPGTIVGIVGHSGAGKSTLLRAIAGAVAPQAGHVRFDGTSRADWDAERLAEHVGFVPQDSILFPGTVKENITRFRRPNDAQEAMRLDAAAIAAAQAIGAHDMIARLPQGYDTLLDIGGTGLSAGQAQQVAIARALFGDPAVLVLDEPTAHLDAEAQRAFAALLVRMREARRTVLFATHSTDVLAGADMLLVLEAGRIAQFGPIAGAGGDPGTGPGSGQRPASFISAITPASYRPRKANA